MADLVKCPTCSRTLEVADELSGREVRCPACDTAFTPAGPEAVHRDFRPKPAAEEGKRPHEPCPACGADIPANVLKCPACAAELDFVDDRPWGRDDVARDCEPHRGGLILTLGISSIVLSFLLACCPLLNAGVVVMGIVAWVMGARDLRAMRLHTKDPAGYGTTQGGFVCGIVGTCFAVVLLILSSLYYGFVFFVVQSTATQVQQQVAAQQAAAAKAPMVAPLPAPPLPPAAPRELLPMPDVRPLDK